MATLSSGDACHVNGPWLSMARDDTCRVSDVCDFPIRCREGTLWITSPEEPGDTVVAAGEQVSVTSRGTVMITALASSSMWLPEGFAADDAQAGSRRRMGLTTLRRVTTPQRPAARASDEPRGSTTETMRLASFHKFIIRMISRLLPPLTGTPDTRERYLSRSAELVDFEKRVRAWDAHEARLRSPPPAL